MAEHPYLFVLCLAVAAACIYEVVTRPPIVKLDEEDMRQFIRDQIKREEHLMTDEEVAERIVRLIRDTLINLHDDPMFFAVAAAEVLDASEAYRLAFVADVRERAQVRRQAKRVRRLVFAKLGIGDRAAVEK